MIWSGGYCLIETWQWGSSQTIICISSLFDILNELDPLVKNPGLLMNKF